MVSAVEIEKRLERILMRVQKPGRYVGGELNQVVKPWDAVTTRVALLFPDIYDIGLPNLGLAILYDQLNCRPDVLAERAYAPWLDMETEMRTAGIPLYGLESKHPLAGFDILGFTLPYESLYTNVLNMLDLAGLPVFSAQRDERHPLVIAGGHAAYNPEPMSAFIDAFAIGEGEDLIHEIVNAHQAWKTSARPRAALLEALAAIPGVYVPALYHVSYQDDGTIAKITPQTRAAALPVVKRIAAQLPPPVTKFLVPSIDVVYNRVAIEIMRGCTRGCRFCQAGMVSRPVRERPVEEIISAIEDALDSTGYEEIALLSLSSSDYTHISELIQAVTDRFGRGDSPGPSHGPSRRHLSLSLPSLRIESFSVQLMDQLKDLRPGGGFTLAPEAATERMRQIINKPITTDQLMSTVREIFSHRWNTVKLYFMIGHPSETLEDVQAIIDVCQAVLKEGRRLVGGRARVHAGVSTFIPKPHTPFQWVSCDTVDSIQAKQNLLRSGLRGSGLKLTWTDPAITQHEAWLARGDRRISQVIYRAWQSGSKFDAWQEGYKLDLWLQAFAACGLDPAFYSHRERAIDEVMPWQHISTAVSSKYLQEEYQRSQNGQTRDDCREQCYACGILPTFNDLRVTLPDDAWKCPPVRRHAPRARARSSQAQTAAVLQPADSAMDGAAEGGAQ
jgi:radical SAM family uncharacterized protein